MGTVAVLSAIVVSSMAAAATAAELSGAQIGRMDLQRAMLGVSALKDVLASTPTPTTTPASGEEPDRLLCGIETPTVVFADRYEVGEANGEHIDGTNPDFNFAYGRTKVAAFSKVSDAKAYMKEIAEASADCKSYYYGTRSDQRYVPVRELKAPNAGDDSELLIATLIFPSGNQRYDVVSFVRRGQLTSEEFLQVSHPIAQADLNRIAKAQARGLDAAIASAKKKGGGQNGS
jgi:hypothetical protein